MFYIGFSGVVAYRIRGPPDIGCDSNVRETHRSVDNLPNMVMIDGAVRGRSAQSPTKAYSERVSSDDDSALTYGGGSDVPLYPSLVSHHSCQISMSPQHEKFLFPQNRKFRFDRAWRNQERGCGCRRGSETG